MDPIFKDHSATAYLALVLANAMFKRLHEDDQKAILEDLITTLGKIDGNPAKTVLGVLRQELTDLNDKI